MAGDVRKIVDIVLQVSGADKKQLAPITKAFEDLQGTIGEVNKAFVGFQNTINQIKTPKGLADLKNSLDSLKEIKVPSIKGLSDGLSKLEKLKESPALTNLLPILTQLSSIKVDNSINLMVNALTRLIKLDMNKVSLQIQQLTTSLGNMQAQAGNLSGITALVNGLVAANGTMQQIATQAVTTAQALGQINNPPAGGGGSKRGFFDHLKLVAEFRMISDIIGTVRNSITGGINAFLEYDQALKDLQAITGATNLEVAQMGKKILEVALTTKFSASEIAQGMTIIGQAGFTASEAIQVMSSVANLATGTLSGMAETVDLMTTTLRVFNIDASRAGEVADIFAVAVNASKLTIEQLKVAMNYLGPVSADAGLSLKETSAAMMTLSNSGLRASTIGTGLRQVFSLLLDPTEKFQQAVRDAGLSIRDVTPGTTSLKNIIQNLGIIAGDTGQAFELFGKRGASALLALTAEGGANFNYLLDSLNETGIASKQAEKQMEGLQVSFKNVVNSLGVLAITIGKSGIAEGFRIIAVVAKELIDVLIKLADNTFARIVLTSISVTAAIVAIGVAFVGVSAAITLLVGKIKLLTAVTTIFSGISIGLVPLLGLLVVAVTAVTATVILLSKAFSDSAKEASDSAKIMADEYGKTAKKIEDYRLNIVKLKEGSDEAKQANLALRDQLLEVSKGSTEAAAGAKKVVDAIDPMTGAFTNAEEVLGDYNKELQNFETKKLIESLDKATESLERLGNAEINAKNSLIDFSKQMGTIFDGLIDSLQLFLEAPIDNYDKINQRFEKGVDDAKRQSRELSEALNLSEAFKKNEISLSQLEAAFARWDKTSLGKAQKDLIDSVTATREAAKAVAADFKNKGRIDVKDTVEDFKKVAINAKLSGVELEAVVDELVKMKKAAEAVPKNILEKWEKEGKTDFLTKIIDDFKSVEGVVTTEDQKIIESLQKTGNALLENGKKLRAEEDKARASGNTDLEYWRDFNARRVALEKEQKDLITAVSENAAIQKALANEKEQKDLKEHLASLRVIHANDATKLAIEIAKAEGESAQRVADINKGNSGDPKQQTLIYERELKDREAKHAAHLANISAQEAQGVITEEASKKKKLTADLNFYAQSLTNAKAYADQVRKTQNPEEWERRNKEVLEAEKKFYDEKLSYSKSFNDSDVALEKQKIENANNLKETEFKNAALKQQELAKMREKEIKAEYESDLISLREYYAKKRTQIEENFVVEEKLLEQQKIDKIKAIDALISATNSEKEALKLKGEQEKEIAEIEANILLLDIKRKAALSELTAEEKKAIETQDLKIAKLLEGARKRADTSKAELSSTTLEEKLSMELTALQNAHSLEYDELKKHTNDMNQLDALRASHQIEIENKRIANKKELWEAELSAHATFAGNMASLSQNLIDSGLVRSKAAFKAYQAFAVAETMISTYASAQKAYDNAIKFAPGPWANVMGAVAAAAAVGSGLARVASIMAQKPPQYAEGGLIKGYSSHSKADNIDIRATAGEYMQPVSAVQKYGVRVMNAIRNLQIPKESLMNLLSGSSYGMVMPSASYALAGGGLVPSKPENPGDTGMVQNLTAAIEGMMRQKQPINIMNVTDPSEIGNYLATTEGSNALLNVLSSKATSLRRILR